MKSLIKIIERKWEEGHRTENNIWRGLTSKISGNDIYIWYIFFNYFSYYNFKYEFNNGIIFRYNIYTFIFWDNFKLKWIWFKACYEEYKYGEFKWIQLYSKVIFDDSNITKQRIITKGTDEKFYFVYFS